MNLIHARSTTDWGIAIGYQSSLRSADGARVHVLFVRCGWWLVNLVIQ